MSERTYKPGDVVFANYVLIDKDHAGEWYIQTAYGELGVINDYGQKHPLYDVRWYRGGTCTVTAEEINPYQGGVQRVTE